MPPKKEIPANKVPWISSTRIVSPRRPSQLSSTARQPSLPARSSDINERGENPQAPGNASRAPNVRLNPQQRRNDRGRSLGNPQVPRNAKKEDRANLLNPQPAASEASNRQAPGNASRAPNVRLNPQQRRNDRGRSLGNPQVPRNAKKEDRANLLNPQPAASEAHNLQPSPAQVIAPPPTAVILQDDVVGRVDSEEPGGNSIPASSDITLQNLSAIPHPPVEFTSSSPLPNTVDLGTSCQNDEASRTNSEELRRDLIVATSNMTLQNSSAISHSPVEFTSSSPLPNTVDLGTSCQNDEASRTNSEELRRDLIVATSNMTLQNSSAISHSPVEFTSSSPLPNTVDPGTICQNDEASRTNSEELGRDMISVSSEITIPNSLASSYLPGNFSSESTPTTSERHSESHQTKSTQYNEHFSRVPSSSQSEDSFTFPVVRGRVDRVIRSYPVVEVPNIPQLQRSQVQRDAQEVTEPEGSVAQEVPAVAPVPEEHQPIHPSQQDTVPLSEEDFRRRFSDEIRTEANLKNFKLGYLLDPIRADYHHHSEHTQSISNMISETDLIYINLSVQQYLRSYHYDRNSQTYQPSEELLNQFPNVTRNIEHHQLEFAINRLRRQHHTFILNVQQREVLLAIEDIRDEDFRRFVIEDANYARYRREVSELSQPPFSELSQTLRLRVVQFFEERARQEREALPLQRVQRHRDWEERREWLQQVREMVIPPFQRIENLPNYMNLPPAVSPPPYPAPIRQPVAAASAPHSPTGSPPPDYMRRKST
ncbi:hypothetical protein CAEBREN_17058 [Caenorhabditis brenneri]|uniref:Uncharacterized protein n=1 Tax=Caenorhabditis brenneri TaxID=135651 RepID=G0P460_CAEBE|nr:hypothetical protein CAEBREN_17058 [Caenorhabditis brenneri]